MSDMTAELATLNEDWLSAVPGAAWDLPTDVEDLLAIFDAPFLASMALNQVPSGYAMPDDLRQRVLARLELHPDDVGPAHRHLAGQHDQKSHGRKGSGSSGPALKEALEEHGGFTFDPAKGEMITSGIAVGVPGHSAIMTVDRFANDGEQFLVDYATKMRDDGYTGAMGGWYDRDNGEIVLDRVDVFADRAEGIAAGRARGEQAVFDLGALEEIDTGGDGGRDSIDIQRGGHDGEQQRQGGVRATKGQDVRRDDRRRDPGVGEADPPGGQGHHGAAQDLRHLAGQHDQKSHGRKVGTAQPSSAGHEGGNEPTRGTTSAEFEADKIAQGVGELEKRWPGFEGRTTLEAQTEYVAENVEHMYERSVAGGHAEADREWYDAANNYANDMATEHGVTIETAAGVTAVLSPSADWGHNVPNAEMVLSAVKNDRALTSSDVKFINMKRRERKMDPVGEDWEGRRISDMTDEEAGWALYGIGKTSTVTKEFHAEDMILRGDGSGGYDRVPRLNDGDGEVGKMRVQSTPNYEKAVRLIRNDGDMDVLSDELGGGHKVRSFYNNIADPRLDGDVTMDTHAAGVALALPISQSTPDRTGTRVTKKGEVVAKKPLYKSVAEGPPSSKASGLRGSYPIVADGYRQATDRINVRRAERGLSPLKPREVQSITWAQQKRDYEGPGLSKSGAAFDGLMARRERVLQEYARGDIKSRDALNNALDRELLEWQEANRS